MSECHGSCCSKPVVPGTQFCPECQKEYDNSLKEMHQRRIATLEKAWNGEAADWKDISPPKKYYGAMWNTLSSPLQRQIRPFIDGDMDLLTFIGCPGAGKTWAAWATVGVFLVDHDQYRDSQCRKHIYTNWYILNEAARDSRLFGETGEMNREFLNKLKVCELLVIDEFATAKPYEAEFMAVMAVIHSSFDNCQPTILITTKSEPELVATLGEAMVSRINSGIVVKMLGKDKRAKL